MEKLKYPCITFQWLNQQEAEPVIFITGKFHAAALNIPYYNLTELKFQPDLVEQAK